MQKLTTAAWKPSHCCPSSWVCSSLGRPRWLWGTAPSGLRWDKRRRFGTLGQRLLMCQVPLRGLGAGGLACMCAHTSIRGGVHRSKNVRRICHLGHCLLSDGGPETLRIQRVLKTVPCPPVTSCQDPGCALWPLLGRTNVLTCVQVRIAGTGAPSRTRLSSAPDL